MEQVNSITTEEFEEVEVIGSGIYDARGKLIKTTIARQVAPVMPASSVVEEGQMLSGLASNVFSSNNYSGNIIIRNSLGQKVISLLNEGTILITDPSSGLDRVLIGKQVGGF